MRKFAIYPIDVTDMIIEGKIEYLSDITKGMSEQTKEAHVPSLEEVAERPHEDFAVVLYHPHLGEMKKLATYDKALTELNAKIFLDKLPELPDEVAKVAGHFLYKAAKYFKLSSTPDLAKFANVALSSNRVDVTKIDELKYVTKVAKTNKHVKAASYALPKQEKYPLDSPDLVKAAVAYFERYGTQLTPSQRMEYSTNVKTAATKHNVVLKGTTLQKYASLDTNTLSSDFPKHIAIRQSYVKDDYKVAYAELVEKSSELGIAKTAQVLERLDKKASINNLWGTCIVDPFMAVCSLPEEKMMKFGELEITANTLKKIAEHPEATKYVDEETRQMLTGPEGFEVFQSLPTPIKNNLTNLK